MADESQEHQDSPVTHADDYVPQFLVSKTFSEGRTPSSVWKFFLIEADENSVPVPSLLSYCSICYKSSGCKGGSTSAMRRHLRNHHPEEYQDIRTMDEKIKAQRALEEAYPKMPKKKPNFAVKSEPRGEYVDDGDLEWTPTPSGSGTGEKRKLSVVGLDTDTPAPPPPKAAKKTPKSSHAVASSAGSARQARLSCVCEPEDFNKAVVKLLGSEALPPTFIESPNFISLLELCGFQGQLPHAEMIEGLLPGLYNRVKDSMATSGLTASQNLSCTIDAWTSLRDQKYISVSLHQILDNWSLQSNLLDTMAVDGTSITGADIQKAFAAWGIRSSQIMCITSSEEVLMSDSSAPVVLCFASVMSHATQAVLSNPAFESAVKKAERIGSFLASDKDVCSKVRTNALSSSKTDTRFDQGVWDSDDSGSILKQVTDFIEVIRTHLTHDKVLVPSPLDIKKWQAVVGVLQVLKDFSDALIGEGQIPLSTVIPLVHTITQDVMASDDNDDEFVSAAKESVRDTFTSNYISESAIESHLLICTFLDPRFRGAALPGLETAKEAVKGMMTNAVSFQPKSSGGTSGPIKGIASILNHKWKKPAASESSTEQSASEATRELDLFESLDPCLLSKNPLRWWKAQEKNLPQMAALAKKYLCGRATSVPTEKAFSAAKSGFQVRRAHMSAEDFRMLSFVSQNLK